MYSKAEKAAVLGACYIVSRLLAFQEQLMIYDMMIYDMPACLVPFLPQTGRQQSYIAGKKRYLLVS
jgi:hypothetical protein